MTSSTTSPLTTDQQEAFDKFARLKVGALFLEQGMGKTRLALELINHRAGRIDDVLWVAPLSVTDTIRAEINKWGAQVPVRLLGYESLSQSGKTWLEVLDWVQQRRVLIVADESIFIKNATSKRTSRMYRLREHADYALILNGTPLTRDWWDIKRQMDFLSPKIIDTDDRAFRDRYFTECRTVDGYSRERIWYQVSEVNTDHLKSLIGPYVFEARLSIDVAETWRTVWHPSSTETHDEYERTRDVFLLEWEASQGSEIVLYKLFTDLTRIAAVDEEKCRSIARDVTGHALVFCNFRREQAMIADALGPHLLVNGDTPVEERDDIFTRSRSERVPLLLTYGVGSYGLNLQHFAVAHFASPTFNYGRTTQAASRIRRLGQQHDIAYVDHMSVHGIDTMIRKNSSKKGWLAALVRRAIDPRGQL